MADSPLVSVIVPVYNVEQYLRKCLDSICDQTYRNLEILCVNDGSTDGSPAILEEYAARDSRIKVFTQANAGLAAARNTGLEHATGEWVTGVDSDDYLEADTYEYALSAVTDETDIVCFGTRVIWQNGEQQPHLNAFYAIPARETQPPTPSIVAETNDSFCTKIFRRSLIEQTNSSFPAGLWYEDSLFWRTAAPFARNIAFLPGEKYNYVRHEGTIMSQVFGKNPKTLDRVRIAERLMNAYTAHPLPSHLQQVQLDSFLFCFNCALSDVPHELHPRVWAGMRQIAQQHALFDKWPSHLSFLKPVPLLLRPFVRHQGPGKSSYGLPGFRPLVIQRRNGMKITRFLGIKLHRKPC